MINFQEPKQILLDFKNIKKLFVFTCNDKIDKRSIVEKAFQVKLKTSDIISLQRYNKDWGEDVDIEPQEIRDRDKIKVLVIENGYIDRPIDHSSNRSSYSGDERDSKSSNSAVNRGVEHLMENVAKDQSSLEYKLSIAKATLQSLKETPRPRNALGNNRHFTCSNCHLKGHRTNNCMQPSCGGYFECGNLALHKEHRDEIKQVRFFNGIIT